MWLFLDIEQDLKSFEKSPVISEAEKESSILMKWLSHLHHLLLNSCTMSESKHGPTKEGACTIFAKHEGPSNERLKQKVKNLKAKIQQGAKNIGVSDLKIETINLNSLYDSHCCLYETFKNIIHQTPYKDVPLAWIFLRSVFCR